jgi:Amt family ammonium transporter
MIGLVSGALCYLAATSLKQRLGYDDSLDVFGVHGVGGFIGTMLAAVFAAPSFGGKGDLAIGASSVQLCAAHGRLHWACRIGWRGRGARLVGLRGPANRGTGPRSPARKTARSSTAAQS